MLAQRRRGAEGPDVVGRREESESWDGGGVSFDMQSKPLTCYALGGCRGVAQSTGRPRRYVPQLLWTRSL